MLLRPEWNERKVRRMAMPVAFRRRQSYTSNRTSALNHDASSRYNCNHKIHRRKPRIRTASRSRCYQADRSHLNIPATCTPKALSRLVPLMSSNLDEGRHITHDRPHNMLVLPEQPLHECPQVESATEPTFAPEPSLSPTRAVLQSLTHANRHAILSKALLVWDKLNRSPSSRNEGRGRRKLKKAVTLDSLHASYSGKDPIPNDSTSPLSPMQRRLNESDNMSKRKVQKILGGVVGRKPVLDSLGLLHASPVPQPSGSSLNDSDEHSLELTDGEIQNPFDMEDGFDDNLEDRVLRLSPTGRSTPKFLDNKLCLGNISFDLYTSQTASWGTDTHSSVERASPEPRSTSSASDRALMESATTSAPEHFHCTKKHPSPSKYALESLEQAFRCYIKAHGLTPSNAGPSAIVGNGHVPFELLSDSD